MEPTFADVSYRSITCIDTNASQHTYRLHSYRLHTYRLHTYRLHSYRLHSYRILTNIISSAHGFAT